MKIKSLHLTIITLVIIFGTIAVTSALGLWKTTNDKEPATYKDGEFAGQYNPADIRGSYSFDDIFNAFEVPIEDLGIAFGVKDPASYALFKCKDLEVIYAALAAQGKEIGTGSVRFFVALYKGLPFEVEADTYLPSSAVEILKAKAKLTTQQIDYLDKHSVVLTESNTTTTSSTSSTATTSTVTSTSTTALTITGSTTFKVLQDWGVKKEDIEKVINSKIDDVNKTIKDFATSKGVEFSIWKEPLQKLVDAIKK